MNEYVHESTTIVCNGYLVTLKRRYRIGEQPHGYWTDPNTGDVYDIDEKTGEVKLIFAATK